MFEKDRNTQKSGYGYKLDFSKYVTGAAYLQPKFFKLISKLSQYNRQKKNSSKNVKKTYKLIYVKCF